MFADRFFQQPAAISNTDAPFSHFSRALISERSWVMVESARQKCLQSDWEKMIKFSCAMYTHIFLRHNIEYLGEVLCIVYW